MNSITLQDTTNVSLDKPQVATRSRAAARLSLFAAALFLVLLAVLHIIKPELDPSWRMVSEYAIGDYGWLMSLAFLSLALSCVSLVTALRRQMPTLSGKIGLVILSATAVGLTLGGVFKTDPITINPGAVTFSGNMHGLGALIGLPTFPIAATLISLSLTRSKTWATSKRSYLLMLGLAWVSLVVFVTAMATMFKGTFNPTVLIGWPNRLLMVTQCAWMMSIAWQMVRSNPQFGGNKR